MNCKFCNKKLKYKFLDLGKSPPSNSLLKNRREFINEKKYTLIVYVCSQCWLVQTKQTVNKKIFFNKYYPYFSSTSKSWLEHSKKFVKEIKKKLNLNKNSTVIEIASNDGYLLQFFKNKRIQPIGIEPSQNTARLCKKKGIKVIQKFFTYKLSKKIKTKFDLVICNNVLAHVPNLKDFIKGLENLLKPNGVITIEFPHLKNLIKDIQFDTIYHEHYFYFSIIALNKIIKKYKLKIFDLKKIDTHGGSLRVYLSKNSSDKIINNNVNKIISEEKKFGLNKLSKYLSFKKKVSKLKENTFRFINECLNRNKKIHAYGAAAKGNTFINFFNLNSNHIQKIYDVSPYKINKYLPQSHIKIEDPKKIQINKPDFIIIMPWNLKKEIMKQLKFVKSWNCKLVTLIPKILKH